MNRILSIQSSARGEASLSNQLANAVIERLKQEDREATVVIKDLAAKPFPHVEESTLTSFFTPPDQHTEPNKIAIRHSDEAIKEIFEADTLVIGAPMYNFSIPSVLKSWIDHIARAGVTFNYTANGPEGLIKGKKVYVVISSGGIYSQGEMSAHDFIEPYLKFTFGFLGMTDVQIIRVEGLSIPGIKETALAKAIENIKL